MQKIKNIIKYIINPSALFFLLINKRYEYMIANRYIFTFRREFNFITIITIISTLGITLGIAALIAVLSIFNGFQKFAENQIIGFDPHVRLSYSSEKYNSDSMLSIIKNYQEIDSCSETYQGKIILQNSKSMQASELILLDTKNKKYTSGIRKTICTGKFDFSNETINSIVMGSGVSERLNVLPDDTIYALSPDLIENSIKQMSTNQEFPFLVKGLFISNSKEYDESICFADISLKDQLFTKNAGGISAIDIKIKDIKSLDDFKVKLSEAFPSAKIQTWYDLHSDIFNIMKLERLMVFIVLSLIIVIAVFNLLASLTMTVVEKQRDISILKAIGAEDSSIKKIFISEGAMIGLMSAYYGTILGLAFCYGQIHFSWFKLDTHKYLIDAIPVSIDYYYVLGINIFAILIAFISTIIPSRIAAKQEIANYIKNN
jgi:lipoprotein-releasing system permease protein